MEKVAVVEKEIHFEELYCTTAGFSAAKREQQKKGIYLQMSADLGYLFHLFAIGRFCCWGDQAQKTLLEASKLALMVLDLSQSQFVNQ